MRLFTVLSLLILTGCGRNDTTDTGDTSVVTPTDTNTSTQDTTDTSPQDTTDTSTQDTSTQDTSTQDTSTPLVCDDPGTLAPGNAAGLGSCYTAELQCGDILTATTVGGNSDLNKADYEDWFCLGMDSQGSHDMDAPERRFYLDMPPTKKGIIHVRSPANCPNTFTMRDLLVGNSGECPTGANSPFCSAYATEPGGIKTQQELFQGKSYQIIIDGLDGAEGVFELEVECYDA